MQEHALPQDVTGYKFHIIGNMTLKQFAEVAVGCVVAFLIFQTNLTTIIKWPLMVLVAGFGALVAFVPIEERPLDHWVVVFFAALYRPTQYYWKRMSKIPEPFLYEPQHEVRSSVREVDLTPIRRQRVKEFLHSIEPTSDPDVFEQYTTGRLDEVMSLFDQWRAPEPTLDLPTATDDVVPTTPLISPTPIGASPTPAPIADPVIQDVDVVTSTTSVPVVPTDTQSDTPPPPTLSTVFDSTPADLPTVSTNMSYSDTNNSATNATTITQSLSKTTKALGKSKVQIKDQKTNDRFDQIIPHVLDAQSSAPEVPAPLTPPAPTLVESGPIEITVPETEHIHVNKTVVDASHADVPDALALKESPDSNQPSVQISATVDPSLLDAPTAPQPITAINSVTTNKDLPFPDRPTKPNIVVGMTLDAQNVPIPGAIIEILNQSGLPARAVKANPLGQFFITTPLPVGEYVIRAEKDGHTFEAKKLSIVEKQVLDPIELRAA